MRQFQQFICYKICISLAIKHAGFKQLLSHFGSLGHSVQTNCAEELTNIHFVACMWTTKLSTSAIVRHLIPKPLALICCYGSLHSSEKALHKILEPGYRHFLQFSHKCVSEVRRWCCAIRPGSESVLPFISKVFSGARSELCAGKPRLPLTGTKAKDLFWVLRGYCQWSRSDLDLKWHPLQPGNRLEWLLLPLCVDRITCQNRQQIHWRPEKKKMKKLKMTSTYPQQQSHPLSARNKSRAIKIKSISDG